MMFILTSCFTQKVEIQYPLTLHKYTNDLVSIQASLDLALQSYILGCMNSPKAEIKNYQKCLKKGKKHIKDNILFILEQIPVTTK